MVYIALTGILFFVSYFFANTQINSRKIYYITFLILFSFSAFRYQVGCDWEPYLNIFWKTSDFKWSYIIGSREPLFWLSNIWLHEFNLSYLYLNIVCSAIFFIGIHVLARRQPDPFAFLVLLFPILIINMPMSGIRQGAAIGIICIALVAFIDRRPIKFSLMVLLASGFHTSALIFLLILPFSTGKYDNNRLVIAILFSILTLILFSFLETAQWALSTYVGTGREAYGAVFRVSFLSLTAIYFFLFVKNKWLKTFPNDYSLISLGSIAMLMIIFIVPVSSVIGDRFGYYLIPIQAMIFARLPYLPFKFNNSLHNILPYIGTFLIFFIWTQSSWHFHECYNPYKIWFFAEQLINVYDITSPFIHEKS